MRARNGHKEAQKTQEEGVADNAHRAGASTLRPKGSFLCVLRLFVATSFPNLGSNRLRPAAKWRWHVPRSSGQSAPLHLGPAQAERVLGEARSLSGSYFGLSP